MERTQFTVVCAACGAPHPRGDSPTQAADCAAACQRDMRDGRLGIVGHYGSDFDLHFFPFVPGKEPLPEDADPVCDACIRAMLDSGRLELGFDVDLPGGFNIERGVPDVSMNAFWGHGPWYPFETEEEYVKVWSDVFPDWIQTPRKHRDA